MKTLNVTLLIFLLLPLGANAVALEGRGEVEFNGTSAETDTDAITLFLLLDGSVYLESLSENWKYKASIAALYDETNGAQLRPGEINAQIQTDKFIFTAGYQTISWGENFGLNPVDIINPNVPNNFFEDNADKSKESSPLLNLKVISGNFDINVLGGATLSQKVNDSSTNLGLNTETTAASKIFFEGLGERDTELLMAAKIGVLISNWADVSVFGAVHGNRTPRFSARAGTDGTSFEQMNNQNHSSGLSFSLPVYDGVLRGDSILTSTDKNPTYFAGETETYSFSVGYDYAKTISNVMLTLGVQSMYSQTEDFDSGEITYSRPSGLQGVIDLYDYGSKVTVIYLKDYSRIDTYLMKLGYSYVFKEDNKVSLSYNKVSTSSESSLSSDFFSFVVGERDLITLNYTRYL